MTIEATFVQGDTAPGITAVLHEQGDTASPINLTGATVKFQMRKPDDQLFTVDAAADVVGNPVDGSVSYTWQATDLSVSGEYDVQWEITFSDGKIQTTAVPNRVLVRRK